MLRWDMTCSHPCAFPQSCSRALKKRGSAKGRSHIFLGADSSITPLSRERPQRVQTQWLVAKSSWSPSWLNPPKSQWFVIIAPMFCFGCIKVYPPLTQPSAGIDTVRHGWISILMKNCLPIVLSLKSHVPRIGLRMCKGKLQENSIFGSSNPTFLDSSRFLPSSTVIYWHVWVEIQLLPQEGRREQYRKMLDGENSGSWLTG